MRYASALALSFLVFAAAGCQKHSEPAAADAMKPAPPAATESKAKAEPMAPAAPVPPTAAAVVIGVPECDDYLAKWESCLSTKVPEASREQVKVALDATRDGWKRAAETPEGKSGLAAACKSASELAATQVSAYGCSW